MARRPLTYSRLVAWLKILLPLLALVVLGTVFLITSDDGFEAGFTFSQADIDTLDAGSYLRQPQIDGMTVRGEPFHLIAEKIAAKLEDQNLVIVTALSGDFHYESETWVKLEAETALLDIAAQTVLLETGGQMETSNGYKAQVGTLLVNLSTGEMSGTEIEADGPLGQISADRFRIEANELENRVLWFENNVRMRYDLQNEG